MLLGSGHTVEGVRLRVHGLRFMGKGYGFILWVSRPRVKS